MHGCGCILHVVGCMNVEFNVLRCAENDAVGFGVKGVVEGLV